MVLPTCQAWLQVVARNDRALGAPSGEELGVRSYKDKQNQHATKVRPPSSSKSKINYKINILSITIKNTLILNIEINIRQHVLTSCIIINLMCYILILAFNKKY